MQIISIQIQLNLNGSWLENDNIDLFLLSKVIHNFPLNSCKILVFKRSININEHNFKCSFMFLFISYIKKIDIYFDIYTQIKKHTIILSCKKEKVIFLQMGNMKSNLSNNVLDSWYYISLIYLLAISQLFLLCNITIVNKRAKENTEWENITH